MGHLHQQHLHSAENGIIAAFFLNLSFTIVELAGGLITNSTIISDAIHNFGDSVSHAGLYSVVAQIGLVKSAPSNIFSMLFAQ